MEEVGSKLDIKLVLLEILSLPNKRGTVWQIPFEVAGDLVAWHFVNGFTKLLHIWGDFNFTISLHVHSICALFPTGSLLTDLAQW